MKSVDNAISLDERELSQFILDILEEARSVIHPAKINLCLNDDLPPHSVTQVLLEDNGDYSIYIKPDAVNDDYTLSHELLHICVNKHVPKFIKVIQYDIAGVIGLELQGYLEHNWILAEQKRRGLIVDERDFYAHIEETFGADSGEFVKNVERILILNNILRNHPKVLEEHKEFFAKNNPESLKLAQRIMSHYPEQELYTVYEARKITVRAIREWNSIFKEKGLASVNLSFLISVEPVFSANQLKMTANVVLGLFPNAIVDMSGKSSRHVLVTLKDGQCCVIFAMEDEGLVHLKNYMERKTLREFLDTMNISYLLR
ncbi:hypothetical protein [Phosphitispora sp. TUW77]|uniref:hypothetical protein n=1 Tax=Phosphitispora sp. TUW77 TaxID=3152361 RepID=UPI003AB842E7